jgi:iron-sulfur cluster repair protein YtfE (RIC family)
MVQLMTGLRIRIDAANAQLVQIGLLVEYLYENLEKHDIKMDMEVFPTWAEARYKEIQEQAQKAVEEGNKAAEAMKEKVQEEAQKAGINLEDE